MTARTDSTTGRASLLTPVGRGAVAVIAVEGAAAMAVVDHWFRAANGRPAPEQPIDCIAFGHWTDADRPDDAGEEVIVCRTGVAALEVQCHGGVAAAERILQALADGGCRIDPWADWVRTHAANAIAGEADVALAGAATLRTAAILLDQRQGALEHELHTIERELRASSDVEASAQQRIEALLRHSLLGRRLTQPWLVAIAGRPNVGKSSLINAVVGYQRAIVFDQPGTTRDVLAAETAIDGWPVRLTDSAGLRSADDPLEAAGVDVAKRELARADLVLWVLDAAELAPAELREPRAVAVEQMRCDIGAAPASWLAIVNKIDLAAAAAAEAESPHGGAVAISALRREGMPALLLAISQSLAPEPPPAGTGVPFNGRQVAWLESAQVSLAVGDWAPAADAIARALDGAPAPARHRDDAG